MSNKTNTPFSLPTVVFTLFVFVCLSTQAFAQTAPVHNTEMTAVPATSAVESETVNVMTWFMGTKQPVQVKSSRESNLSSKKQLINSGIAPNRLLLKTFMKKATIYNNTIA